MPLGVEFDQRPLAVRFVIAYITLLSHFGKVYLKAIIRPTGEYQAANASNTGHLSRAGTTTVAIECTYCFIANQTVQYGASLERIDVISATVAIV